MVTQPTGTTRVAGVIGSPVRHSLSPVIHNAAFAALDLDWTYLAFDVAAGDARSALDAMRTLRLGGLSVTMPHKADVAEAVDRLMPEASALRAVNCVSWDRGELVGHNTDGGGFIDSLEQAIPGAVAGRACFVAGAGGAARAVVHALAGAGAGEIVVINRTPAKAEIAAQLAGERGRVGRPADAKDAELIVNATAVGMRGTPAAKALPIDPEVLHGGQVVAELVYHPLRTPLMAAAQAAGATVMGGVGMLVHQAARQFELWTGERAPLDAMAAAASEAIAGS